MSYITIRSIRCLASTGGKIKLKVSSVRDRDLLSYTKFTAGAPATRFDRNPPTMDLGISTPASIFLNLYDEKDASIPRQASISTGVTAPPLPSRTIAYRNRRETRNNQYVITYEVTTNPIRTAMVYLFRLANLVIELIRITISFIRDFFLSLTLPLLKFFVPAFGRSQSIEDSSAETIEQSDEETDDTDESEDESGSDNPDESEDPEKLRSDDRFLPK